MRRFFQFLFMPCEGYTELISAAMDGDLSSLDHVAVRLHSTYCKSCRRYRKQIMQLRLMLSRLDENIQHAGETQLTSEARERILIALRRETP